MMCLGPRAGCYVTESRLYVATPALIRYLGIDAATIDPSTDFLADRSVPTDELVTVGMRATSEAPERPEVIEHAVSNVQRIDSRKLFGSPKGEPAYGHVVHHA